MTDLWHTSILPLVEGWPKRKNGLRRRGPKTYFTNERNGGGRNWQRRVVEEKGTEGGVNQ